VPPFGIEGNHTVPVSQSGQSSKEQAMTLASLLLIMAFVLFVLASFGIGSRINLTAAGLACVVLTMLLPLVR
jgi:hypothetical protein